MTWPPVRTGPYASTKVWGESLARYYSDTFGISVIALRIGFVNAEDRPANARIRSVWCSQRDIVNAIELAVDADDSIRYDILLRQLRQQVELPGSLPLPGGCWDSRRRIQPRIFVDESEGTSRSSSPSFGKT